MYVRKRFDIEWTSLFAAMSYLGRPGRRAHDERRVEEAFATEGPALACLSVRSGFDLLLSSVDWAVGSEVIMTAISIPAMGQIVEHHGFAPVAVDVDTRLVRPRLADIEAAIGPRTRAIVVAHLFGTWVSLDEIRALARRHDLLLIEDCAQSYEGRPRATKSLADVSMYSFGSIKTATALGGAVMVVKDPVLLQKMRLGHAEYPVMSTREFGAKVSKYMALCGLSLPVPYGAFVQLLEASGKEHDLLIRNMVKGFSGPSFFQSIRQRPCAAQLRLLARRLETYDPRRVLARQARGHQLADLLSPELLFYGCGTRAHSYWLFALVVANPDELINALRAAGFDATSGSSTLAVVATRRPDAMRVSEACYGMEHVVYLPLYPQMPARGLEQMAGVINEVGQAGLVPGGACQSNDCVSASVHT
ncbi:aminotransferase class V-fold PLP-dependent enzyme [Bradymonas sediminis]|nr:aminotransferase class V-fold PLP-dependent enzyme [Bradymonas sediminis]TDP63592.1 dTDP-4-amino-4,6-dideoxygalactose transaminase [Bradymonas sediminis]